MEHSLIIFMKRNYTNTKIVYEIFYCLYSFLKGLFIFQHAVWFQLYYYVIMLFIIKQFIKYTHKYTKYRIKKYSNTI